MPYRILITTHHITSQAKLATLRNAALEHNVSCLLKTGPHPPGVMLCEGSSSEEVKSWHAVVKKLRYKDYRFVGGNEIVQRTVNDGKAGLRQVSNKKEMGELLDDEARDWWRCKMNWR